MCNSVRLLAWRESHVSAPHGVSLQKIGEAHCSSRAHMHTSRELYVRLKDLGHGRPGTRTGSTALELELELARAPGRLQVRAWRVEVDLALVPSVALMGGEHGWK